MNKPDAPFYLGVNHTTSSLTEGHKKQTYKRIKRIFDSSDDDDSPPLT